MKKYTQLHEEACFGVIHMTELPLKAFCLMGSNGSDKVEITICEVFGFPESTSFKGGYDFKGDLVICAGSYKVRQQDFYSSTGIMYSLLISLLSCYNKLEGMAEYKDAYENFLHFKLRMKKSSGRARIEGSFQEYPHLRNELFFEFETDQTCILSAISDLKQIETYFGDNQGKRV